MAIEQYFQTMNMVSGMDLEPALCQAVGDFLDCDGATLLSKAIRRQSDAIGVDSRIPRALFPRISEYYVEGKEIPSKDRFVTIEDVKQWLSNLTGSEILEDRLVTDLPLWRKGAVSLALRETPNNWEIYKAFAYNINGSDAPLDVRKRNLHGRLTKWLELGNSLAFKDLSASDALWLVRPDVTPKDSIELVPLEQFGFVTVAGEINHFEPVDIIVPINSEKLILVGLAFQADSLIQF